MAYDVDFWYLSQDACEITTDFTPFSDGEEECIYMKTSDFFKMVEDFTDIDLIMKAKAYDKLVKLYPQKEEIPSDEFFDEMGYVIKECADNVL